MPATLTLLAADSLPGPRRLAGTMWLGMGNRPGRVVGRMPGGGWRRAEQGPAGPLLLQVRPTATTVELQVWGHRDTPADTADRALVATRRWAGLEDDVSGFAEVVDGHPP